MTALDVLRRASEVPLTTKRGKHSTEAPAPGCDRRFEPAFPRGLPFAADGFGNFWVIDLWPDSRTWGPIYYACHDPPVFLFQGPSLEHFLEELVNVARPLFERRGDLPIFAYQVRQRRGILGRLFGKDPGGAKPGSK